MRDFVIENGVLKEYQGNGGDVVIPAGVTEIGAVAFSMCKNLTIYGVDGSCAKGYARKHHIPFVVKE